jgi:hypothetical protein
MNQISEVIELSCCALCGLDLTSETFSVCHLCQIAYCPAHVSIHLKAHRIIAKGMIFDSGLWGTGTAKSGTGTVIAPDVRVGMRCHGCGGEVVQVGQKEADKLRELESPDGRGRIALECRNCEVVLFEDELIGQKFVPPEFRPLPTRPNGQETDMREAQPIRSPSWYRTS